MKYVQYEVEDRLATITLNRPEKRNAFNEALVQELKDCLEEAATNEQVKLILLKANGQVFSAGADLGYLQQLQSNTREQNIADSTALAKLFQYIYTHPKVIIAQIEGHAIAGGCGLATVCDFSFAVPEARFGYSEVKIGFIPAIVMVFLLRKIGEGKARELLLSGKLLSAVEAKKFGLINEVVPADEIADKVQTLIQQLKMQCSTDALRLCKQMIAEVQNKSLDDAIQYAAEMNALARETTDCKAGISAFLHKEKITW